MQYDVASGGRTQNKLLCTSLFFNKTLDLMYSVLNMNIVGQCQVMGCNEGFNSASSGTPHCCDTIAEHVESQSNKYNVQ